MYWDREGLPQITGESYGPNPVPDSYDDRDLQRVLHILNYDAQQLQFGKGYHQADTESLDLSLHEYIMERLKPRPNVMAYIFSRAFILTTGMCVLLDIIVYITRILISQLQTIISR